MLCQQRRKVRAGIESFHILEAFVIGLHTDICFHDSECDLKLFGAFLVGL
jgi:hypothetical protein